MDREISLSDFGNEEKIIARTGPWIEPTLNSESQEGLSY